MALYQLAQAGDPEALSLLVRQNIALVQALCTRFPRSEDAFQQGCIGLVYAIRHFSEDRGLSFSTYAVPCILGEMKRAFFSPSAWRVNKAIRRLSAVTRKLTAELCREPTVSELAAAACLPESDVLLLLEKALPPVSLDSAASFLVLPDPHSQSWLERFLLRDILDRLNPEDRQLLYLRYRLNQTQAQAAKRLCLTQPSFSRREKKLCMAVRAAWIGE